MRPFPELTIDDVCALDDLVGQLRRIPDNRGDVLANLICGPVQRVVAQQAVSIIPAPVTPATGEIELPAMSDAALSEALDSVAIVSGNAGADLRFGLSAAANGVLSWVCEGVLLQASIRLRQLADAWRENS